MVLYLHKSLYKHKCTSVQDNSCRYLNLKGGIRSYKLIFLLFLGLYNCSRP